MLRQNSRTSQLWEKVPPKDKPEETLVDSENHDDDLIDAGYWKRVEKFHDFLDKLRIQTSLDDLFTLKLWRALFAEFLGTFFLVLVAVGSTVQGWNKSPMDVVQVALTFGFCVATVVWIIGNISGGHINPAVTCAMLVTRRISLIRALLYIIVQCVGSVIAAAILKRLTPDNQQGGLGTTVLSDGVTPRMGFGIEFCITMFLVLTVFATCDNNRSDHSGSFPLMIGFSVTVGHLWAVEFCGSSMNPARSFGPAVVMNIWQDHVIYWAGPITGGIVAGLLYDNVLAENASLRKAKDFIIRTHFQDDDYPARKRVFKVLQEDTSWDQRQN